MDGASTCHQPASMASVRPVEPTPTKEPPSGAEDQSIDQGPAIAVQSQVHCWAECSTCDWCILPNNTYWTRSYGTQQTIIAQGEPMAGFPELPGAFSIQASAAQEVTISTGYYQESTGRVQDAT